MPAGAIVVSKIHRTVHPFKVWYGHALVRTVGSDEVQDIRGPYQGETQPGTRRVLAVLEDTLWTTFHLTDLKDPVEIERQIIEPHENVLLSGELPVERLIK